MQFFNGQLKTSKAFFSHDFNSLKFSSFEICLSKCKNRRAHFENLFMKHEKTSLELLRFYQFNPFKIFPSSCGSQQRLERRRALDQKHLRGPCSLQFPSFLLRSGPLLATMSAGPRVMPPPRTALYCHWCIVLIDKLASQAGKKKNLMR